QSRDVQVHCHPGCQSESAVIGVADRDLRVDRRIGGERKAAAGGHATQRTQEASGPSHPEELLGVRYRTTQPGRGESDIELAVARSAAPIATTGGMRSRCIE